MPTIASGNEVEVYFPVASSVTITPLAGFVEFGCSSPSGTDAPAFRKVYAAATIAIPAGSHVFLRAVNGSATYTDPTAPAIAAWAVNLESLVVGAITRNADGAATAASVEWPDGATGAYAATTLSTTFPGAVDAYTVTHLLNGQTLTATQPAVTRNADGAVTVRPDITVA